ncbi:hypothetical protein RI367_004676 [Sorochytrium milnesiophthora]
MDWVYVERTLNGATRARKYTRYALQEIFQFMGCKHSDDMAEKLFQELAECPRPARTDATTALPIGAHAVLSESQFCTAIRKVMQVFECDRESHWRDFEVAFQVKNHQQSVCVLLGGTSGCGKSTLASLVGSRMSITTVLSTDNIRHLLRNFYSKEECPVLWTSSYYAGDALPAPAAGAQPSAETGDPVIEGFEAQNQVIYDKLDDLITSFERRRESLIIEGVHLSVRQVTKLMAKHPSCIPFLIYISNEMKHTERFAIRAKYMTLEPRINKYIKYFKNIRQIQKYLCKEADQAKIPKIDNTNVDRSLAILHRTVFNVLARLNRGEQGAEEEGSTALTLPAARPMESVFDADSQTTAILHEEYTKVYEASWSSKAMLQRIREMRKGAEESGAENGRAHMYDSQDESEGQLPGGLMPADVEDMDEDTLKFASLGS